MDNFMVDVYDQKKRSEVMAKVRSKDTGSELAVRRHLHRRGLRFRLHRRDLPGRPDIVFPSRRVVVFVHGCFWHGHLGCKRAKLPATRPEFWRAKIAANVERDARALDALWGLGWQPIVVWECEINEASLDRLHDEIAGGRDGPGAGTQT